MLFTRSIDQVSVTLLKCKRQGLADRCLRKRGRVWEYVYVGTERGRKRLHYWRVNGKASFGHIDVDEIVDAAKRDVDPLLISACLSVTDALKV